jgi:peptidoglycan/xylan/chitin deacetylase (PgdA/CDA1 family)
MLRRSFLAATAAFAARKPVPDKLVVLCFDDAVKSHRTYVGPLLAELGFRATFFVTHRWMDDRANFMTWEEIAELHRLGFEIGNHSWTHPGFNSPRNAARLAGELALVENELARVGVPKPASFAWPGNAFGPEAVAVLRRAGYRFARRGISPEVEYGKVGVGPGYDPARHHPLLIPTTGDAYPEWTFEHFRNVISEARAGRIAVLQFHGVPDTAHPWVHTPPETFERYMRHLKDNGYATLALRDLAAYIDPAEAPHDPTLAVRYRSGGRDLPPEMSATRAELAWWSSVMRRHGFSEEESREVAGVEPLAGGVAHAEVLPYPGGRHPRIGFLDGAIDPLRGAKASVFLPWAEAGYVVVDVPEALFAGRDLIFLAHTHVPTVWNARNVVIENTDWERRADGSLASRWRLPDGVVFGATVAQEARGARMELWLHNASSSPLSALRAQVCVLLKGAPAFAAQTNENKELGATVAGVRAGTRRIATEWENCGRVWANPACPCMHSDPRLPDCPPGATVRVAGRLWFEGD